MKLHTYILINVLRMEIQKLLNRVEVDESEFIVEFNDAEQIMIKLLTEFNRQQEEAKKDYANIETYIDTYFAPKTDYKTK